MAVTNITIAIDNTLIAEAVDVLCKRGGSAHNNIQRTKVGYLWERTA